MNSRKIIQRLKDEGWVLAGGKGSHEKFKHPNKRGHVIVPHPKRDIPVGTLKNIYKQAHWKWEI